MLDFADVVAINKFERRGAEDALRDVGRQLVRNREAFGKPPGGHAGLRHQRRHASTTTASPRSTSTCAACSPSDGLAGRRGRAAAASTCGTPPALRQVVPAEPGALPRRDRRDRARLPRRHRAAGRRPRAACSGSPRSRGRARAAGPTGAGVDALLERGRRRPAADGRRASSTAGRAVVEAYSGDEQVVTVRDQRDPHPADAGSRCRGNRIRRVALPRYADDGELRARSCAARTCRATSPSPPGCSRSSATARTRRGCSPARATPFRTNRRFHLLSAGPAGDPAVDGVRLGHPLRPRPRPAPRHLRQGRHLRRLDRDARRHEGALRRVRPRARPTTSVSMTINGPAPTILAYVPQHRDRPAGRRVPRRAGPRARPTRRRDEHRARTRWRTCAARCRPTSSRRTRARTPASSPPSSRCG